MIFIVGINTLLVQKKKVLCKRRVLRSACTREGDGAVLDISDCLPASMPTEDMLSMNRTGSLGVKPVHTAADDAAIALLFWFEHLSNAKQLLTYCVSLPSCPILSICLAASRGCNLCLSA